MLNSQRNRLFIAYTYINGKSRQQTHRKEKSMDVYFNDFDVDFDQNFDNDCDLLCDSAWLDDDDLAVLDDLTSMGY